MNEVIRVLSVTTADEVVDRVKNTLATVVSIGFLMTEEELDKIGDRLSKYQTYVTLLDPNDFYGASRGLIIELRKVR